MNLFRPSLDAHHPSQSGESFSEAFLYSSSRVRDALPEQHRAHFDELRKNIFAFCDEFGIPKEALRNKEAFGVELTSKRIPPQRMQEAVLLFRCLEYLVTNREPLREAPPEYLEEVERLYHLREQYMAQVSLLERVGVLKDGSIMGIDGKNYPVPTLEQIAQRLYERKEILETKQDQKFTKLLLVPFGMDLDILFVTLQQFLRDYKKDHETFGRKDPNIPDESDRPDWNSVWIGSMYTQANKRAYFKLLYHPRSLDPEEKSGRTKAEILADQGQNSGFNQGWRILFFQAPHGRTQGIRPIPREGQGQQEGEINPRLDMEAHKQAREYLDILLEAEDNPDSPYHGESGMTPEDWIVAFMTHLEETGKLLDDDERGKESIAYLVGALFSSALSNSFDNIPDASWYRGGKQAFFNATSDWRNPEFGSRFVVVV